MAQKRIKMKKLREILRLHFNSGLSNQKIADALKTSKTTVFNCLKRFEETGLTWPLPESVDDTVLEAKMYPEKQELRDLENLPDFEKIHQELSRPHTTLELLWEEYRETNPDGLGRSSFYRHYKRYKSGLDVPMKQDYKGGDKLFVDYSGATLKYFDRVADEWVKTEFFVCSWGASSYCYAEASISQNGQEWVCSHVRALNYFGCVPKAIVPDNLKSGVTKPVYYEPEINALYEKFAQHYDTAILPTRVRKPKDKPVVESNVLHLQRFIFGRLRDRTFFSLRELNEAIWALLDVFNARLMQQYKKSRKDRFAEMDKPHATPLPDKTFVYTQIKPGVRVAPNYHIEFEKHFYSVPFTLARKSVDVYQINNIIEVYHNGKHVCRHKKAPSNYRYTTRDEHMPANHRFVKGWSTPWLLAQADKIGPATAKVAQRIIDGKRHPEQGFRAVMGILNLGKKYPKKRVEKAAERALHYNNVSYHSIKSILTQGLDEKPPKREKKWEPVIHENLRGRQYYD